MKTTLRSALLASLLLCGSPLFAQTGVPRGISYQATITDETGGVIAPLPGAAIQYNITLQVFDSASDGALKWAEIFNGIPVSNGRFSVILGQGVPDPGAGITNPSDLATIFDEQDRFVEISVVPTAGGTTKTFKPRQQLLATPTAMRARFAEVAQGFSPELQGQFNAKAPLTSPSFQGTVGIDSSSSNTGSLFPGLRFGDATSLEGISSKRTPGIGQYGLSFYTGNRERMTLTGTGLDVAGRLDAGSANIAGNLDLGGRVAASGEIVSNSSIAVDTANTNNGTFSPGIRFGNAGSKEGISSKRTPGNTRSNGLSFYTNEVERMLILNDGRIGIGTTDPRAALHIAKDYGSRQEWEEYRLYWPVGPAIYDQTTDLGGNNGRLGVLNDFPLTLYCEGWTAAIGYFAISDERIKKVSRLSNPTKDLEVLNKIEITDYTFIDQIAQGPGESKKVIAQQVEEVFPQAISKSTGVVPDIFKKATFENGWIMLATDLKKGEKVKLMTPTKTAVYKVLEVKEGRFRTAMNSSQNEVFVYGREVNDFRSVDYDGISMLNVSATQELHRLLEAKTKEIEVMKKEMAALKGLVSNLQTKDETRESRLIAIEKLLTRDREPVKTASK